MPPVQILAEDSSAFTVIERDEKRGDTLLAPPRNVNVVKPRRRDDAHMQLPEDELTAPPAPAPAPPPAPAVGTIIDPKFSRALDFKLRRLKEKEVLEANLRRPTRRRPRGGALTASDPDIGGEYSTGRGESTSRSHPRIDIAGADRFESPKMGEPPSPRAGVGKQARGGRAPYGEKPRFVTTVKAGRFLLPPPEIACLLGLQTLYPAPERDEMVYSYASRPKAVAPRPERSLHTKKREKNGSAVAPAGAPAPAAGPGGPRRAPRPGGALGGVRALVAGVVGLAHMLDESQPGSVAPAPAQPSNLMHDKRVVRGSTFGSHPHAAGDGIESAAARAARTRRRALARRAAAARLRPGTPPPAPGRRHHPIQTEYYLEELFDKGVESEVGVQTDLFADRPATPQYVPAKTGADAHTQIYPGDLFDFDLEVQPILEVLVGKTAEQALAEVAQEEELGTLREQQRRYGELRDAERAERARLAAQHARLRAEAQRRARQAGDARAAAQEARDRAAAHALVHGYVAELLPAVLAGLRDQGYLVERIHRGVDEEFMPWLVTEVSHEIESIITSRDVISEIVRDVVDARAELYREEGEARAQAAEGGVVAEDSITPRSSMLGEGEETPVDE